MHILSKKPSLFIPIVLCIISCSGSQKTATHTPPANFDASSYINPEDYGYDLMSPHDTIPESADTSFVPIEFDEEKSQQRIKYPRRARRGGIQGKVILQIYIDSTGTVTNMETVQSPHSLLTTPSQEAVFQTDYNPATLNGKPVNSFIRVPFLFRMRTL